jgi:hypothetical protein
MRGRYVLLEALESLKRCPPRHREVLRKKTIKMPICPAAAIARSNIFAPYRWAVV